MHLLVKGCCSHWTWFEDSDLLIRIRNHSRSHIIVLRFVRRKFKTSKSSSYIMLLGRKDIIIWIFMFFETLCFLGTLSLDSVRITYFMDLFRFRLGVFIKILFSKSIELIFKGTIDCFLCSSCLIIERIERLFEFEELLWQMILFQFKGCLWWSY